METLHKDDKFENTKFKVLDLQDIDFLKMLPGIGRETKQAYQYLANDLKEYASANEMLRVAILVMGSDVIEQVSGEQLKRDHSSMIYLDTDIFLANSDKHNAPEEMSAPAGFRCPTSKGQNSVSSHRQFAVAYRQHPIFKSALYLAVMQITDQDKKEQLVIDQSKAFNQCDRFLYEKYYMELINTGTTGQFEQLMTATFNKGGVKGRLDEKHFHLPGISKDLFYNLCFDYYFA